MQRSTDALLLVLTAVAASTDAVSYLGLGTVFPANMTGNTVLLGIGISGGDFGGAGRSAVALGGFVLSAAVAGALQAGQPRPHVLRRGLVVELAAVAAAAGWWLAAGRHPAPATQYGLIALVSTAMGIQSATIMCLDVGVSTTFITGTWTSVSRRAGRWLRRRTELPRAGSGDPRASRQALVLVVYFAAALLAGYVQHVAGVPAVAIPLGLLTCATFGWLAVGTRLEQP